MYRGYNQSREMLERKPQFDPTFWEICVDPENLCRVPGSNRLHYESEEETRSRQDRLDWVEQTFSKVVTLMDEVLTPRQNQIVRIYFLDKMTECEIADRLGISASSISQHLFGKKRGGKRVGGAISKLTKVLIEKQDDV